MLVATGKNVNMASLSYTKTASGLETSIAKGDLTLNGVEIFNSDIASDTFGGKLNLINSFSAETGVVASATFDQTFIVDPNNIIKGDVIKINGTEVTVTASNDIAALVTALNGRSDATGLTASRSGNNITFKGENVQSLTIGQKGKVEISDTLVSAVNDKGASAKVDRTLTIDASDLHAGREYELKIANGDGTESPAVTVTVTATSTDTVTTLAKKLADAVRGADQAYRDGTDAKNISTNAGVITFNQAAGSTGDGLKMGLADITFKVNAIGDIFGTSDGAEITSYGSIKLDSTANSPIKIDLGEVTTAANHKRLHGFLEANVGAADYDVNAPQLSASGGTSMSGLSVGTAAGATAALSTLDRAIDAVNANRGTLGALQNRLEYTINNLSSISNATSGARGRILDADFAKETSELTKNQILTQAAAACWLRPISRSKASWLFCRAKKPAKRFNCKPMNKQLQLRLGLLYTFSI